MIPIVSIKNLSLRLSGQEILRDISFDLQAGDYVCLVGPNGSGKTSVLRCVTRVYSRWLGEITVLGKPVRSFSQRELARHLAYLPQADGIAPPYTVEDFVLMARYPFVNPFRPPSAEDREAVEMALRMTELWSLRHRVVRTLSGGERQKVYLAGAIAQQAKVLLLDEPTTFLDVPHQEDVRSLLHRINRQSGVTILAATHDLNAAVLSANRILALREGRLLFSGSPEEFMTTEVVRQVFGFAPQFVRHPQVPLPMIVPSPGGGAT
ncbi:MAG TPA: ABC transporter ATP-binding protein [Thermogutta sp.]|nr:ABC transporter ATP-binding protein [Thermogutta sp.]HOP78666.1 ABC transporter ATP-binding protein [Thermogutta sp.]HPU07709.1 ABC transporter ATP-binding protein [Thermogutta sp.]HQF12707.1 ABC transporter ATP-binding protein [Thermogutta sp.]